MARVARSRFARNRDYRGAELLILENDKMRATIVPEKGSDIVGISHKSRKDVNLLFKSPMGFHKLGSVVPSIGTADSGFMDYYEGGWQDLLPNTGFASTHRGASWGLHGETALLPWTAERMDDGDVAMVRLTTDCVRYPMRVIKDVTLREGEATLRVSEDAINLGEQDIEFAWVQHIVFDRPLVNEEMHVDLRANKAVAAAYKQTRLKAGTPFTWPNAPGRDGSTVRMDEGPPSNARFEDNLFIDIEEPWYAVRSSNVGLTVGVSWNREAYRGLWFWLNHGALDYPWFGRTRNLGLEPASTLTENGLGDYVKEKNALHLDKGKSMKSRVALSIEEGVDEVKRVEPDGSIVT